MRKAKSLIENEINYLNSLIEQPEFGLIITRPKETNFFIKHLSSRLACLNTYLNNIEQLCEQMQTKEGLTMDKKITDYLRDREDPKIKDLILDAEVSELDFVGLNEIYSLKMVYDVPEKVIHRALAQIAGGIATLAVGIVFPPSLPVCGPIAGALISEGVCDIVMELISQGETEFSEKEYAKSKAISYGISIATMGISAASSALKILSKASKACRTISAAFRRSPFMKKIFEKVANKLSQLAGYFEKMHLEKINKTGSLGAATRKEMLKHYLKEIGVETGKSVVKGITEEKLTKPALEHLLQSLKPEFKKKILARIKESRELSEKLSENKEEQINSLTNAIIEGDTAEHAIEVAKEITLGVMSSSRHSIIKEVAFILDTIITVGKINNYTDDFCKKLGKKLQPNQNKKHDDYTLNKIIENLAEQLTETVFSLVIQLGTKFSNKFLVDPLINRFSNKPKKEEASTELIQAESKERRDHKENLRLLGLNEGANEAEIKKAFRLAVLKHHPDKGGSHTDVDRLKMARDSLINHLKDQRPRQRPRREESNTNENADKNSNENSNEKRGTKLIIQGNSDINDCGLNVLAKIFDVDKHDLFRLTGMRNSEKGSHIIDHEAQFNILGLETKKIHFNNNLTKDDIHNFLKENNTSQSMLFLNSENDSELGHVYLIKKEKNDIVIYDNDISYSIEELPCSQGTLLMAKDLDTNFDEIRNKIITNPLPHQSLFNMTSSGSDENKDLFGSEIIRTEALFVNSNTTRNQEPETFAYITGQASEQKIIRYDYVNEKDNKTTITINSRGGRDAHYCPFIKNTHNWERLKKTQVVLKKKPWNYTDLRMFTGGTLNSVSSLSSLIVSIGKVDLKVYFDSNPTSKADNKIRSILNEDKEEKRVIYRIDHEANRHIELPSDYREYYGTNPQIDALLVSGSMFLCYDYKRKLKNLFKETGKWQIIIQNMAIDIKSLNQLEIGKKITIEMPDIDKDVIEEIKYNKVVNKIENFKENPNEFLNVSYLIQKYPSQNDPELSHVNQAGTHKILKFDLYPGNIINNRLIFYIDPNQEGEFTAHYSPYIGNTSNWESLLKTEVKVKLNQPEHKYVLTGTFSGCSLLIAVGKEEMNIYHDSKPGDDVSDKTTKLKKCDQGSEEIRKIIRIDHSDYQNNNEITESKPWRQLSYGNLGGRTLNEGEAILGQIMLFYNSGWYIAISSYIGLNHTDFGTYPTHTHQISLASILD